MAKLSPLLFKRLVIIASAWLLLAPTLSYGQVAKTPSGIDLDLSWKQAVYDFAEENLVHSAWGLQHYERNYLLAKELGRRENLIIDDDVLFAAAFLHDMGVFEPYAKADAEHSQTATENIEELLTPLGFPENKLNDVKTAILAHMFYAEVPDNSTAQILHDADTLDFLGTIGVTRIISLTSRDPWASDLATAIATLENFSTELPPSLITETAKEIARTRVAEMTLFIETLKAQSQDGNSL